MIYYKHIELKNYDTILEKSKKYITDNFLTKKSSGFSALDWADYLAQCPEILTAFDEYGWTPCAGFVYVIYKQSDAPLHFDYVSDIYNKCRINIPIFNCEYSTTFYYKNKGSAPNQIITPKFFYSPELGGQRSISYHKFDNDDPNLIKVDEVIVDKPTIMRVQEPHRVFINETKVPRVVITLHTNIDSVTLLDK